MLAFAVGLGPLCLPVPWLAWLHAGGAEASWQRFLDACLYRHFTAPPAGLASLYLALAMGGTAGELAVLLHGQENRARIAGSWLAGALLGIVATSLVAGPLGMALSR